MKASEPKVKYSTFEELLDKDGYLVYTNVGTSMMPLLRQYKDIIEIRKKGPERCKKYDAVLYKCGSKHILHRIIKVRKNDYVIVGDHCTQKEYGVTDDQILGVMTRIIRNGRSITPENLTYKVYVHLWCDFYPIRVFILLSREKARSIKSKLMKCLKLVNLQLFHLHKGQLPK